MGCMGLHGLSESPWQASHPVERELSLHEPHVVRFSGEQREWPRAHSGSAQRDNMLWEKKKRTENGLTMPNVFQQNKMQCQLL